VTTGDPGSEADAPRFAGTGGRGAPAATARRRRTSAELLAAADGEDVARQHLHAEQAPQLQKETSEKGAAETAGGAYGSRDSPLAQAAQPTGGKSDKDVIEEQTAGSTTSPADDDDVNTPPGFAGEGGSGSEPTMRMNDIEGLAVAAARPPLTRAAAHARPPGEPSPWSE
jgi:hypothetical protein